MHMIKNGIGNMVICYKSKKVYFMNWYFIRQVGCCMKTFIENLSKFQIICIFEKENDAIHTYYALIMSS